MNAVAPRLLPVLHTVKRAVELLWLHRYVQMRVIAPAFIVLAISIALGVHVMAGVPPEKVPDLVQTIPVRYAMLWLGLSSIGTILLMMFSVTWRRFLLIDAPLTPLIFNKPFRRYLVLFEAGYFAVILGSLILTNIVLDILATTVKNQELLIPIGTACLFAIVAGMMLLVTRYVLLFTTAAIGNNDLRFRAAGSYMKGNVLRFAAAWIILVIGMNLVDNAFVLVFSSLLKVDPASVAGSIVVGVLTSATMAITTALTSSLAALTYDFLVHGNGPELVV